MTTAPAYHLVLNGAPICRPRSGQFWGLYAHRDAAAFHAEGSKCKACAKSKRWAHIAKKFEVAA